MLFLLHSVNDCFESFWLIDGEVSKNLTVKIDAFGFHTSDKLGVGKTKLARSVVDAGNPEGTKIALFVPTIAVSITKGLDDALLGEAIAAGAIVLHPFGGCNGFLMFSMGGNAAFNSHD